MRALHAVGLVVTIIACGSDKTGTTTPTLESNVVTRVTVVPGVISLSIGGTQPYIVTALNAAGVALSGHQVTWSSSAPGVATVTPTGFVTAVSTSSKQTATSVITATVDGVSGSALTTVVADGFPWIESVTITPSTMQFVPGGGVTATASVHAHDAGLGVDTVRMSIVQPVGYPIDYSRNCLLTLTAGTKKDGVWTCPLTWLSGFPDGHWTLSSVTAANNNRQTSLYEIGAAKATGSTAGVTVLSSTSDMTPPQLTEFSFSPTTLSAASATAVNVTAKATDAGTGVAQILIHVGTTTGLPEAGTFCSMKQSTSDPSAWTCALSASGFTGAAGPGLHPVLSVELIDRAGNSRVYTNAQLLQAGFPAMITVTP